MTLQTLTLQNDSSALRICELFRPLFPAGNRGFCHRSAAMRFVLASFMSEFISLFRELGNYSLKGKRHTIAKLEW